MGNQLRGLVAASLGELLALFRPHAAPPPLDARGGAAARCAGHAVFETELAAEAGGLLGG
jgi:hypothetical protein